MSEWRDIPGYEGHYQASDDGHIKSLSRSYTNKAGQLMPIRERIMRPGRGSNYRYLNVILRSPTGDSRRTWKVHQLVARAFHGLPPFDGAEVCHNDGDPLNNRADNLRWGSRSENGLDSVRHGSNIHSKKTHCPQGHAYTPENTLWRPHRKTKHLTRVCRTCIPEWNRQYYLRKKARLAAEVVS